MQLSEAVDFANLPPAHLMQLTAPDEGWYWPDVHCAHGARPSENMPSVQVELQLADAAAENKPEEHAVHVDDSVDPVAEE